jgi:hypothetical protein
MTPSTAAKTNGKPAKPEAPSIEIVCSGCMAGKAGYPTNCTCVRDTVKTIGVCVLIAALLVGIGCQLQPGQKHATAHEPRSIVTYMVVDGVMYPVYQSVE